MRPFLVAWLAALGALVVIDGLWLGVLARDFYAARLAPLLREPLLIAPAAVFYVGYSAGLTFLAVRPHHVPGAALASVALDGAVVGALAYGTYAMTNLATLRGWPLALSLVDVLWGTLLSGTAAVLSALAVRHVG